MQNVKIKDQNDKLKLKNKETENFVFCIVTFHFEILFLNYFLLLSR